MNETPTDENVVESLIRSKGIKEAKMKKKWKVKSSVVEEFEKLKASTCKKLDLMTHFNDLKQNEVYMKQNEVDMQLLMLDTSIMNEAQREIHDNMIEKVKSRRI